MLMFSLFAFSGSIALAVIVIRAVEVFVVYFFFAQSVSGAYICFNDIHKV